MSTTGVESFDITNVTNDNVCRKLIIFELNKKYNLISVQFIDNKVHVKYIRNYEQDPIKNTITKDQFLDI